MFTGIVQAVGRVVSCGPTEIQVHDPGVWVSDPWQLGESIAVNGCCLTLVGYTEPGLRFDLSEETWRRTALSKLRPGDPVNLERAMRVEDRFGGHIVQGHVDGIGRVVSTERSGNSIVFGFEVPNGQYLIDKGSIAIEGISLTVVEPQDTTFSVWVIPQTAEHTTLGAAQVGDPVNIEYDVLARYLEKLVSPR